MRVYALLLGIVLTSAYGYAAAVAVASANPSRRLDAGSVATIAAGRGSDELWYGGVLEPITVESGSSVAAAPALPRRLLDAPSRSCVRPAQRTYHAVL